MQEIYSPYPIYFLLLGFVSAAPQIQLSSTFF